MIQKHLSNFFYLDVRFFMKVKVLVTGLFRDITAGNGRTHRFSEAWVYLPNAPFPVQVDHYGDINLEPGDYEVPILIDVRDRRMGVRLNFGKAVLIKAAV